MFIVNQVHCKFHIENQINKCKIMLAIFKKISAP